MLDLGLDRRGGPCGLLDLLKQILEVLLGGIVLAAPLEVGGEPTTSSRCDQRDEEPQRVEPPFGVELLVGYRLGERLNLLW